MSNTIKFIFSILLQILLMSSFLFVNPDWLLKPQDILLSFNIQNLNTLAKDSFLLLAFDINKIDSYFMGDQLVETGHTVFITLVQQESLFYPEALLKNPPHLSHKFFLTGTVLRSGGLVLDIRYGFEKYPIQSLSAEQIQFLRQNPQGIASVQISSSGKASIKRLYINDNPFP